MGAYNSHSLPIENTRTIFKLPFTYKYAHGSLPKGNAFTHCYVYSWSAVLATQVVLAVIGQLGVYLEATIQTHRMLGLENCQLKGYQEDSTQSFAVHTSIRKVNAILKVGVSN